MLKGRWGHTLSVDAKGRLLVPGKVREDVLKPDGTADFMLGRYPNESCLWLHTLEEHDRFVDRLDELSKESAASRCRDTVILSEFYFVTADKQGRLLIPEDLRNAIDLSSGVVLIGTRTRVEIWDSATLKAFVSKHAPAVMARLEDVRTKKEAAELRRHTEFPVITQGTTGPEVLR